MIIIYEIHNFINSENFVGKSWKIKKGFAWRKRKLRYDPFLRVLGVRQIHCELQSNCK